MGGNPPRRPTGERRQRVSTPPPRRDADAGVALGGIQHVLDTPLAELTESEQDRAAAEELAREALTVPGMLRLREVVRFVNDGRPATQAGNLEALDAVAAARSLRTGDDVPGPVRSMDDVPGVAHVFRWAISAELRGARGTKIVAGPRAGDLERDPLSAWSMVAIRLLEHGLLDCFQRGWRKIYVELLDGHGAPDTRGDPQPSLLHAIDDLAWEQGPKLPAHVYGVPGSGSSNRSQRQTQSPSEHPPPSFRDLLSGETQSTHDGCRSRPGASYRT
jgi:hypothetical protein